LVAHIFKKHFFQIVILKKSVMYYKNFLDGLDKDPKITLIWV